MRPSLVTEGFTQYLSNRMCTWEIQSGRAKRLADRHDLFYVVAFIMAQRAVRLDLVTGYWPTHLPGTFAPTDSWLRCLRVGSTCEKSSQPGHNHCYFTCITHSIGYTLDGFLDEFSTHYCRQQTTSRWAGLGGMTPCVAFDKQQAVV